MKKLEKSTREMEKEIIRRVIFIKIFYGRFLGGFARIYYCMDIEHYDKGSPPVLKTCNIFGFFFNQTTDLT